MINLDGISNCSTCTAIVNFKTLLAYLTTTLIYGYKGLILYFSSAFYPSLHHFRSRCAHISSKGSIKKIGDLQDLRGLPRICSWELLCESLSPSGIPTVYSCVPKKLVCQKLFIV
jgi:hypothetical protein